MYAMKRTSLFLDVRTLRALKAAAERRNVSVASLVREAVVQYLSAPRESNTLPSVAGRFSSRKKDTSARTDDFLWRDPHR
jgi:hypothetical protein